MYQPQYEQAQQQEGEAQQQAQEVEAGPTSFPEGPTNLSLLPRFGNHVTCKLWSDAKVSNCLKSDCEMRECDRVIKRGGRPWHRHEQPHRRSLSPEVRTNRGDGILMARVGMT